VTETMLTTSPNATSPWASGIEGRSVLSSSCKTAKSGESRPSLDFEADAIRSQATHAVGRVRVPAKPNQTPSHPFPLASSQTTQ
jgi:hypothetical protein